MSLVTLVAQRREGAPPLGTTTFSETPQPIAPAVAHIVGVL